MPKTNAERVRECRARKKLLKQKPPPKTAAQRNREYRARKKALKNAAATIIGENETMASFSGSPELHTVNPDTSDPVTSRDDGNILYNYLSQTSGQAGHAQVPIENVEGRTIAVNPTKRTRKSCAQRCREYRQRKKAMEGVNAIVIQRTVINNRSSNTKADKRLKAIKAPSHSLQHQQQVVTTVNRANKFRIAKLGNGATSTSQASSLQASTSSTHALPISEGDIKIEIEEEKLFDPSSREYIEYPNTAKRARIEDDTTNVPTICSVKQEIEDATEDQDLVEAIEVKKEPGDDEPDVADYLSVAQIKMEIGDDFVE